MPRTGIRRPGAWLHGTGALQDDRGAPPVRPGVFGTPFAARNDAAPDSPADAGADGDIQPMRALPA